MPAVPPECPRTSIDKLLRSQITTSPAASAPTNSASSRLKPKLYSSVTGSLLHELQIAVTVTTMNLENCESRVIGLCACLGQQNCSSMLFVGH
jgi:hypothetical protein